MHKFLLQNGLRSIVPKLSKFRTSLVMVQNNTNVILPKSFFSSHQGGFRQRSMAIHKSDNIFKKKADGGIQPNGDLIKTLSEQLIQETTSNVHRPTTAENEIDTMSVFFDLVAAGFDEVQARSIIKVMIGVLNDKFFATYAEEYLRDFEVRKQEHLFHSLTSEIQFTIRNSRDAQFNQHHLQIMRLQRDLTADMEDINETLQELLGNERQLEFNNLKFENTLQHKQVNIDLSDCDNKISIDMLAGIKYDIENLRWQTTRSGLIAVVVILFLIFAGMNAAAKKQELDIDPASVTRQKLEDIWSDEAPF